ncbi:MAG: diguanylate cyclase/phosphodiesterase (GGDEF & EAL domains) with PAS/PAC sensor(s) [uncultured Frankineae bacterium]|uniref:Diguanylate cyclase/phosphodiesterase (GGDEF & EAL domains) with PAS/PAC sensor(S) n=1 Tax=uncultured Frankineae bacterium TaxID=437475 RepID=A0A6J4MG41_9ACTN|nr:MAG: diguanylate cyclase/phosphodiesterase (GGDEF & EAL domains) with PAS/PAC sensor(s) [uncultured Frankineae bacterium]
MDPRAPSETTPGRRLAPLTALLALCAVFGWAVVVPVTTATGVTAPWFPAPAPDTFLTWACLLVAFVVAESTQLHVELRRQTVSLSLSELPLVLGLFLVDPLALLLVRLGGSLLVAAWRRPRLFKTAFNTVLFTLEVALAVSLFSLVRGASDGGPQAWAAAYAATVSVTVVTGALLVLAVVRLQGAVPRSDVLVWLAPLVVSALLTTSAALLALLVLAADSRALPLLVLLALLLVGGYRAYGRLLRRHSTLELVQAFTAAMGAGGTADTLLSQALRHTRTLLAADCAEVVVLAGPDLGPARGLRQCGETRCRADVAAPSDLVADVLAGRGSRRVVRGTQDPQERVWLAAAGVRDALLVPVTGPDGVVGALVVSQRLGETSSFTGADLTLLEMVAAHLEIALRSAQLVERLRDEATHDTLTGLPNRALFHERLDDALDRRARGQSFGVLLMDLDGFKEVNDTLGHESGDEVLVEVAARLTAALPPGVTVARLGGDEFALLVPGEDDPEGGAQTAARVHRALRSPVVVGDVELEIRASVGVAVCPDHGDDGSVLLRHADVAMYAAKGAQEPVRFYSPAIDRSNPRRLALVNDLRTAVETGQLTCHYQPKVRVADASVTGVEALVRWQHPTLGNVVPDDFIPIAEHTGLIVPLTSLVLRTALEHCAQWADAGHVLEVAVNVSPRALLAPDFVLEVAEVLARTDVPAHRLTLEITESSVMHDPRRATAVLDALHALGTTLSVDDFGTGYSSLAYLQKLPVHEVKIDRSFVSDLATDEGDVAIVRAIVDLGHNLGLRVAAEGVEDARSLGVLQELGCDTAQGYLISRPLPHDRLLAWLGRPAGVIPGPRLVALG